MKAFFEFIVPTFPLTRRRGKEKKKEFVIICKFLVLDISNHRSFNTKP